MNRIFSQNEIKNMYDGLASSYDLSLYIFRIFGFQVHKYRREAIQNLQLVEGDTVVDLGCGTGLNFSLLQEKLGPEGKIIGVDLSSEMLQKANNRVSKHG